MDRLTFGVECRASDSGPQLHATILEEGRAAVGGRAEVFAPGSLEWPTAGIVVRAAHYGAAETRAVPVRTGNTISLTAPATPAIFAAVAAGKRFASVEFHPLREVRTVAGIREIQSALLTAAALTDDPEYGQTAAEVRTRKAVRVWL